MTRRQKSGLFAGTLLLVALLVGGAVVQKLVQPKSITAQEVLTETTSPTMVVGSAGALANLHIGDGQTVLLATVDGGALLIYDADATDTVNNSTVYNGPNSVGRYKAFALNGISSGSGPSDGTAAEYTIVGTGVAATDTAAFAAGLSVLNDAGGGVLYINGTVSLNADQDFTAAVSLIGVPGTDATIVLNDDSGTITWNETSTVLSGTDLGLTATAAFADHIQVPTATNTLVAGDWFYAFSDDPVDGCTHNEGYGNNPGEIHQVKEIRQSTGGSDYIVFDDFIVDALTNGQKVVELSMLDGIEVKGLKFKWAGSTTPTDSAIRFRCCANVVVENCHWELPSPNEIQFIYCADSIVTKCTFEGAEDWDGGDGYGVVFGPCNRCIFSDSVAYGYRHVFTTTAQSITETGTFTANAGTDVITSNSHGHLEGTILRVSSSGSLPGGLSASTDYYVTSVTANTFQLASSYSGSYENIVNITSAGSGTHTWTNIDRQGTPRNVLVKGVIAHGNGSSTSTLVPFDTHAEGWGIVFDGCVADIPSEYRLPASSSTINNNRAFQTRSRNTIFRNCTVNGSGIVNPILILGENAKVLNCYFENFWYGIQVKDDTSGGVPHGVDGMVVSGCVFKTSTGPGVLITDGANHTISYCEFVECGSLATSEFRAPIYIESTDGLGGHRVMYCSLDNQTANILSIGGTGFLSGEVNFVGNNMRGYAGEGPVFTANAGTDTINSALHELLNGQAVRLTTTGTLPAGLAIDTTYYVVQKTNSTFKLSLTAGGAPVNITDGGTGTHKWDRTTDSGLDWGNPDAEAQQVFGDSYNWTD